MLACSAGPVVWWMHFAHMVFASLVMVVTRPAQTLSPTIGLLLWASTLILKPLWVQTSVLSFSRDCEMLRKKKNWILTSWMLPQRHARKNLYNRNIPLPPFKRPKWLKNVWKCQKSKNYNIRKIFPKVRKGQLRTFHTKKPPNTSLQDIIHEYRHLCLWDQWCSNLHTSNVVWLHCRLLFPSQARPHMTLMRITRGVTLAINHPRHLWGQNSSLPKVYYI